MLIKGRIGSQTVLGLLRGLNLVGLSGAMTLVRPSEQALLVLRRGQLLHIATSSARERPLQPTSINADLVDALDGRVPTCAVALPFTIGGEVSMIVYGDVVHDRPIEAVELLEAAISQASLALERTSLQARVRQLEVELARLEAEGKGHGIAGEWGVVA